jgi:hypothetical protein
MFEAMCIDVMGCGVLSQDDSWESGGGDSWRGRDYDDDGDGEATAEAYFASEQ